MNHDKVKLTNPMGLEKENSSSSRKEMIVKPVLVGRSWINFMIRSFVRKTRFIGAYEEEIDGVIGVYKMMAEMC